MNEIGKPLYFSLEAHVAAVESLVRSDEIELALRVADMVPSWYRVPANYPPELAEIKRVVARQLYDQVEYSNDNEEAECTREFGESQWGTAYMHPRDQIITQIVRAAHNSRQSAWIFDLGCSHGNLPLGLLKELGPGFTYKGVGLNWRIVQMVREWARDVWRDESEPQQLKVLYCSEVLEHASRLEDVVTTALKECVDWDVVLLSVPLNTLGGGLPNYHDRRLGHVRCFNEQELFEFASKHWPGRTWEMTLAASMVIVGRK